MFLPLLTLFCIGVLNVGGLDLPNYIPKCSISDPNLNDCMVENGNECLPRLMQGDSTLAIPSLSPLNTSELLMEGNDLDIELFDVYSDSMKNFRIKEFSFSTEPDVISYYVGYVNHLNLTGANYNILSGNVVDIPAYGNGTFSMTFLGLTINVTGSMTTYEKDDETYLNMGTVEGSTNVIYANYHFENIKSPDIDDVNAYIEEHVEEFTNQLEPALSTILAAYSSYAVQMIITKLPISKIFLA